MPVFKVNVKWGKEKFTDVECNTDDQPEVFKAQLFALSGVQPDRQKVMVKGKTLKDDTWEMFKLKDGMTLLMMGSADALPQAPDKKTVFMEDMTEEQLASALELPAGLVNLGNTCYLNATVQCLRSVPELRSALDRYQGNFQSALSSTTADSITASIKDLYNQMDRSGESIPPIILLQLLHMAFPQFAEKTEHGTYQQQVQSAWQDLTNTTTPHYKPNALSIQAYTSNHELIRNNIDGYMIHRMDPILTIQGVLFLPTPAITEYYQDANECWVQVVRLLQQKLPGVTGSSDSTSTEGATEAAAAASSKKGFIDQYFSGQFESTLKCTEAPEEPATNSTEQFFQMCCYISQDVKYMSTGLKLRLQEEIEKNSPTLERNAMYKKESKISRLPAYLTVQMIRFFYKEKSSISAKILKDVKFPIMLDTFDLCTPELQKKLEPIRDKYKIMEDRKVEEAQKLKAKGDNKKGAIMQIQPEEDKGPLLPYDFPEDIGCNNSGYYELQAVLTHQGRSSSSGHYVGWVRRRADEWIKFDDDKVYPVTEEEVLKLSGGGDWHCAYVLLYGPRRLHEEDVKPMEEEKAETEATKESQAEKMDTQ